MVAAVLNDDAGELQSKISDFIADWFSSGQFQGAVHQLQRSDPITLDGIHISAAATVVTAVKFAGHQIPPVIVLAVACRRRAEQTPGVKIFIDHLFSKAVQFAQTVQTAQALPCLEQIVSDHFRIIGHFKA